MVIRKLFDRDGNVIESPLPPLLDEDDYKPRDPALYQTWEEAIENNRQWFWLFVCKKCNISINHGSRQSNTVDGENKAEPL